MGSYCGVRLGSLLPPPRRRPYARLATRIALYEAGADARYIAVNAKTKVTEEGTDFGAVNPLGLVPTLRTDQGEVLSENAAILQYVTGLFPAARLAPADGFARTRLQQWLCFIGTELHKGLYAPLLDKSASGEVKAYAEHGRLAARGTRAAFRWA